MNAFVHLNNSAVSLLHRGCFLQAMETFGDAMEVMKTVCPSSDLLALFHSSGPMAFDNISLENDNKIQEKLHRAELRLSRLASFPPSTGENGLITVVISKNESPIFIERSSMFSKKNKGAREIVYLVRIESVDSATISDDDDVLPLEAVILVYNCGIAYRCVLSSLTTSVPFFGEQLNVVALGLFQYSHARLCSWGFASAPDDDQDICILLFFLPLLQLSIVTKELGLFGPYRAYRQQLLYLRPVLLALSAMEAEQYRKAASAAA
jgi:hypothetical protein